MFICKNPQCPRSYLSADGQIVVNHVRNLRAAHNAKAPVNPPLILRELAPQIYQTGEMPCAGCGRVNTLAHHTGPDAPAEVNTLLENIELLQNHGVLPDAA